MNPSFPLTPVVNPNLFIYALVALLVAMFVRRMMRIRSLKQYTASDVDRLQRSRGEVLLLDVRSDSERTSGAISGSLHIPLESLRARINELDRYNGKEIICCCQTGSRSVSAALLLRKNGFTVANLQGGIAKWNFLNR